MNWLLYLLAGAAGAANPFQSGANAELNKQLTAPLWAGVVVYLTGLAGVCLLAMLFGKSFPFGRAGSVVWWAWLGGVISIASTMAGLTLAQKLGAGAFTGINITAAIVMSVLLDQFGWMGFKQHTASPWRIVGCVLMVGGVWLVSRF